MKVLCVLVAVLCFSLVNANDMLEPMEELAPHEFGQEFESLLELKSKLEQTPQLATYVPGSDVWDNPATDVSPTPTIPSTPSCTIRGQTVFEIRKMRADAKQIGMSIMYEIQTMEKRKAYVEQMTSYLNDRIRELNKVKRDLSAEQKWISVSNQRISELAQKEKLIKLQDVMSCIRSEQARLNGENQSKNSVMTAMANQAANLEHTIADIRTKITQTTNQAGAEAAGQSSAATAAAAASAPAASAPAS